MIIPKPERLNAQQLKEITAIVAEFNCTLQEIKGAHRSIYAILGEERREVMRNRILGLEYIDRIDAVDSPYRLMDRSSELSGHHTRIEGSNPLNIGGEIPLIIAGPCAVDPENKQLTLETAHALKEAGAHVLRGGVWKPRTMPYSYQGDARSLEILLEARAQTGLPLNIEAMNTQQLHTLLEAKVDMIQIGARNALNYSLLREVGEATSAAGNTPVLLKRSRAMTPPDEFLAAAEYIAAGGNPNVLLCPRGTMPNMPGYRNHPDECITPLLKEKSWAPVVVDPSHSVGRAQYVPHTALAAIAYGADGLCIEAHINPARGIGDDPKQALTPGTVAQLIKDATTLRKAAMAY